jgi:tetratricopeptide (TPR) repeat protein
LAPACTHSDGLPAGGGRAASYSTVRELILQASSSAGPFGARSVVNVVLDVLEASPAEPLLLNALGVVLYELGEPAASLRLFEAALALDPAVPAGDANRAAAQAARGVAGDTALADRVAAVAARAVPASGMRLTLCLIVRDEEELLPACLEAAAPAADEIVVVDTGSTDATVAIAESFGARVLHRPWDGSFSAARNAALEAATGDWVLFLDADEQLQADPAAVRELVGRTWREAFFVPMTSLTGDGSTSTLHPALRLWRNRPAHRFEGRVHERLAGLPADLPERFELADLPVLHHGYLDRIVAERHKAERNLELLAAEPPGPYTSFNLGSEHLRSGDWAAAADRLDAALASAGDAWPELGYGPLLAARAARARREAGRLDEAEALLEDAIPRLPEYTDLTFELAHCALARGASDRAALLLRRCLAQGDAPPRYLGTVGAGSHLARGLLEDITLPG